MKFTCEKAILENSLMPVSRVVSTKATLPILENILIEATSEGVRIAATDLEIGMKTSFSAKVEESGTTTIPARVFSEVVSRLEEGVLEISLDPNLNIVQLNGNSFRYQFNVLPVEGYPVLPDLPKEAKISLSQEQLKKILKDVIFSASVPRDDNPVLSGILFKLEKELFTLVALDGYRLAKRSMKIPKCTIHKTIIVPARALLELSRILKETEDSVEIYFGEHQISFKLGDTVFFSRLMEGQFPQYERVIPEKSEVVIKIEKENILQALRRASVLAQERESPRLVKINLSGNKLVITANTQDLGQAYEELNVEGSSADKEITVAFNAKYLIDAISILEKDTVKLELGSSTSPGVVRGEKGEDFLYVVMPVRTVGELVAA